jgi:hypothetical protein
MLPTLAGFPWGEILGRRKELCHRLSTREHLDWIRMAALGGSTRAEVVDLLELCLLDRGFAPVFYQSDYGQCYDVSTYKPENAHIRLRELTDEQ